MNKEQLQQQIKEMELKLQEMKNELNKLEKFEFKYPACQTSLIRACTTGYGYNGDDKYYLKHGRYRIKEENAELSLQRNKEANLIEALAEQIDPDWKADWGDIEQEKSYIYWSHRAKKYYGTCVVSWIKDIGIPYMSPKTAKTICEMLNNGEFTL